MSDTQELVDVIYDMYDLLQKQGREISILRKELGLVSGKVNGVLFPDTKFPAKPQKDTKSPQIKAIEGDLEKSQKTKGVPLQPEKTVVHGHIYNADQKPVNGATVKIMKDGSVVKSTKTNLAGKWMAHLPPGKYSIKYTHSSMAPSYRMAVVKEGQKELEVL